MLRQNPSSLPAGNRKSAQYREHRHLSQASRSPPSKDSRFAASVYIRHQQGMERVEGIEPSYQAWEARVLPLNYTRLGCAVRGS